MGQPNQRQNPTTTHAYIHTHTHVHTQTTVCAHAHSVILKAVNRAAEKNQLNDAWLTTTKNLNIFEELYWRQTFQKKLLSQIHMHVSRWRH